MEQARMPVKKPSMRPLGPNRRAMSSALRGVVSRIELTHEHYEHKCHDPRAKGKTMPRSRLVSVKFVPVLGDTHAIPVDKAPGPG